MRGPGLGQVAEECWAHRGLLAVVAGFCRAGCLMPAAAGSAGLVSPLIPPSPAARGCTTRDRPHNDPHKSADPPRRRRGGRRARIGVARDEAATLASRQVPAARLPRLAGAGGLAGVTGSAEALGVGLAPAWPEAAGGVARGVGGGGGAARAGVRGRHGYRLGPVLELWLHQGGAEKRSRAGPARTPVRSRRSQRCSGARSARAGGTRTSRSTGRCAGRRRECHPRA